MPDRAPLTVLQQLLEQLDDMPTSRPISPIKLTQAQLDQLRAAVPTRPSPDPAAWVFGAPIILVDTTVESTPYTEGWIKCPSCGEPANDHGKAPCDKVLVFGRFGDFAVRPPDFGWRQQQLLEAPGFAYGDLFRIKAGLLAMAVAVDADDEEMALAIARWEDDGGSCR